MQKITKRQLELLGHKNSKIIKYSNIQTKAMLDLVIEFEKITEELRKSMGNVYETEEVLETIQSINKIIIGLSDFTKNISQKTNISYKEPSSIYIIRKGVENEQDEK
ncbi:hypothetical protein LS72_010315 [Helicobacter apodemus]|uniref:Uncharacterized protein n=1 Tax=Helicobacter apodemus TaxID=135569 RepID=A0A4U8UC85_9HELI|nr:hypothetical protein [Helicobacter apodemus]TLE13000.1 hypothetical protein LS72_010315 [Helicobacter apodemus]